MVTNVGHAEAGLTAVMFEGISFDGGKTWTTKLIALGAGDPLGDACCDPSLSFDRYGNLFLTYLYQVEDQVPVALSTDGGLTFHVIATQTHVGGFDFIPAQPDRSVDAEPGLAWDRTSGPHAGRVYLVYTREHPNESDNTDIYLRHSDNGGATWSAAVRVNDDHTTNSQFLPKISLDPTTGNPAWSDNSNSTGDNPDSALHQLDIYTAAVPLP